VHAYLVCTHRLSQSEVPQASMLQLSAAGLKLAVTVNSAHTIEALTALAV
jgi:hypothetical protein